MNGTNDKQSGFSLVEVLIAMTILMMVLFIGTMAYRTYSVYWQKELGDFNAHLAEMKGITNVHHIIRNIKPMVLKGGKLGGYVYFEGGDSVIRAIANEAFTDENAAAAFELKIVNNQSIGGVRVEYREYAITSNPVIEQKDIGSYGQKTILLSGFEDIRFEYFGWPSYADYNAFENPESQIQPNPKTWFGLYSGQDTLMSPEAVKLRLKRNGNWSEINIPLTHFFHKDLLQFVGVDL